jgi:ribose transport system ATP-binding protein
VRVAVVAPPGTTERLLVLDGVTKVFPNGTRALRGVDLAVTPGTVHGLVGANGAGKSTLIKIMSGVLPPTAGRIAWRGQPTRWHGPGMALQAGIATVHQHSPLVPTLSVLENVFLGSSGNWLWKAASKTAELDRLFATVGYELPADQLVGDLSIGDRQMVSILQAMSRDPALLILDEPTASLSVSEREVVHGAIRNLRQSGTSVVFVSHLLDEIISLTEVVTILRDGRVTLDEPTAELTKDRLISAIVGRPLLRTEQSGHEPSAANVQAGPPLLEVKGLTSPGRVSGVSFTVAAGEVVGLAGLLGSGRSEILHAVYGSDAAARGTVRVGGNPVRRGPARAVRAGLALVPEDRAKQGLIPGWEVWRNITLAALPEDSWRGMFPRQAAELRRTQSAIESLSIKPPTPMTMVDQLSGGNAQKTVFGKWLHGGVKVLLLDEPTAGIDVGAKRDIQVLIRQLTKHGSAVVVVDSEFNELLAIADRVLVVRQGRVIAERDARRTSEMELVALASGLSA